MIEEWGAKKNEKRNLVAETEMSSLQELSISAHGNEEVRHNLLTELLFTCIRQADVKAIKNMLAYEETLVNGKMFGYEGRDVYGIINAENDRCYTWSGKATDGFFYPLHIAAESNKKEVVLVLLEFGADSTIPDYRGLTAEEKSNKETLKAFYENRGLKFEATERYVGSYDVSGKNRSGLGTIYYKPEGYLHSEKLHYKGTFKDNLYHGKGTLYWTDSKTSNSDFIQYKGRFKGGLMHGKGMLFDEKGNMIYNGTFRDNERDGHGEMFEEIDGTYYLTYKGEFSKNMMHGFGVAHYSEGHSFVGRFENNVKAGVGVYSYPNGDRFEGMFYNDKPDGAGSYYTLNKSNGQEVASHHLWQGGRKMKETNNAFIPFKADMPATVTISSNLLSQALESGFHDNEHEREEEEDEKEEEQEEVGAVEGTRGNVIVDLLHNNEKSRQVHARAAFTNERCGNDWKALLGKAVRVPRQLALQMKLIPSSFESNLSIVKSGKIDGNENEDGDEDNEEKDGSVIDPGTASGASSFTSSSKKKKTSKNRKKSLARRSSSMHSTSSNYSAYSEDEDEDPYDFEDEDDKEERRRRRRMARALRSGSMYAGETGEEEATQMSDNNTLDDVLGTHFVEFGPLFTAYVYVCSASKIFERRFLHTNDSNFSAPVQNAQASVLRKQGLEDVLLINEENNFPDFDLVYHLVIDAVDDYNEKWEEAYRMQQEIEEEEARYRDKEREELNKDREQFAKAHPDVKADYYGTRKKSLDDLRIKGDVQKKIDQRKNLFMNDSEKREELNRRQRAELAAKKGAGVLQRDVQLSLGSGVVDHLDSELFTLLTQEQKSRVNRSTKSGGLESILNGLPSQESHRITRQDRYNNSNSTATTTSSSELSAEDILKGEGDAESKGDINQSSENDFAEELLLMLRLAKETFY
jgi:hypothetical protein